MIINRFTPGKRIPTHHHDGAVHAYTLKGRWHYLEYDFVASPGSFVFEQAGSTHTLEAMPDSEEPVEVFFVIEGGLILYTTTATTWATPTRRWRSTCTTAPSTPPESRARPGSSNSRG